MSRLNINRMLSSLALLTLALSTSGCALEDFVASDEFSLLWAVVPLLVIAGIATPVFVLWRRGQLERWNVADSPTVPSAMPMVWRITISAVGLFIAFLAYNLYVPDMDPTQIAINAVAWAVGSAAGVFATDRLGRRLSDPKALKRDS